MVSQRILFVKIKTNIKPLNVISLYAPEAKKPLRDKDHFYDNPQKMKLTLMKA